MKTKTDKRSDKKPRLFPIRTVICVIIAAAVTVITCIAARLSNVHPALICFMMLILLLVTELAAMKIYSAVKSGAAKRDDESAPILGNITLDFILKLHMPVVICDERGQMVWYNRSFTEISDSKEVLSAKFISDISDVKIEELCENADSDELGEGGSDGVDAIAFDRYFKIKSYRINARGVDYIITVWDERTEAVELANRLAAEEPIIAYVMIDNLDELMQFVQEKYRSASSVVEEILKDWADSVGGILKEYERDKFIFLFEARYLDGFIASKFDILDRVREVRLGEGSMPVTVSIGISRVNGTLAEKDRDAHSCLDLALQRGGDQVVVKNSASTDFYGGRTKTVQKRAKVKARVIVNQLSLLMANSGNVLIMGHRNPDYDSIGACIGLARLAGLCGVSANIVVDENESSIKRAINRVSALPEYADMFVDKTVGQDMLRSDTLVIVTDVNNYLQFEAPDIADNAATLAVIDHHRKTGNYKREPDISYIEPSASSASELVAEMLEQALPAGDLHREEADVLFAGMALDTKQFSRNTGVRTFSAALYLRSEGANPMEVEAFFKSGLDDFMREAKFSMNVITYRQLFAISMSEGDGNPQDRIAAAKAADKLLSVSGVMASFALVEVGEAVHISARSAGNVNVQLILEKMGGGGYYEAAGAYLKDCTMTGALTALKEAIDDYMKKN